MSAVGDLASLLVAHYTLACAEVGIYFLLYETKPPADDVVGNIALLRQRVNRLAANSELLGELLCGKVYHNFRN